MGILFTTTMGFLFTIVHVFLFTISNPSRKHIRSGG